MRTLADDTTDESTHTVSEDRYVDPAALDAVSPSNTTIVDEGNLGLPADPVGIDATTPIPEGESQIDGGTVAMPTGVVESVDPALALRDDLGTVHDPAVGIDVEVDTSDDFGPFDDPDRDGIHTYAEENEFGTDPYSADTDGDGLSDYVELVEVGTDPLNSDTDGDGLDDGFEYGFGPGPRETDPLTADTDGDGINDWREYQIGTRPWDADSDEDGLNDGLELQVGTDPLDPDTDDDGLGDGFEWGLGSVYDPLSPDSIDGAALDQNVLMDSDEDGLTDGQEIDLGSDPWNPDSDGDGLSDFDEWQGGFDPLDPDTDDDGVGDLAEFFDPGS